MYRPFDTPTEYVILSMGVFVYLDKIVPFENTTSSTEQFDFQASQINIGQNKRTQCRLIRLIDRPWQRYALSARFLFQVE